MHFRVRYRGAKKFLKGFFRGNFWAFLFFLTLSAAFWLFLTLEDVYEVEVPVKLALRNVPENVVITTPLPREIKMRVKDHGRLLLKYRYTHSLGNIVLDFRDYDMHSGHVSILTADVAKSIVSKLQNSTTLVGFTPDTLEYYYNFGVSKMVPVKVAGNIIADSLYCVTNSSTYPTFVKVYAPRQILDTLTAVYTTPLNITDLTESTTIHVALASKKGIKFVPRRVSATFNVDQMTENSLPVRVEYINFPAGKSLKTFPGIVNVTFQVGMRQYKDITADKFAIVVSYDEVANNTTGKLRLSLKSQPAGITHVRIAPEEVEFLIEDSNNE